MGKRISVPIEDLWRNPCGRVRHPPVAANGLKIGESVPAVTKNFVAWRDIVSLDGLRKVGGVRCDECTKLGRRCTCEPIVDESKRSKQMDF